MLGFLIQVWPYWAYTYAPDPFQPKPLSDEQNWRGELSRCPGFEDDPDHYQCSPQPQGWSNCWKCPPKDPFGGGYTAYEAVSLLPCHFRNCKRFAFLIYQNWKCYVLDSHYVAFMCMIN